MKYSKFKYIPFPLLILCHLVLFSMPVFAATTSDFEIQNLELLSETALENLEYGASLIPDDITRLYNTLGGHIEITDETIAGDEQHAGAYYESHKILIKAEEQPAYILVHEMGHFIYWQAEEYFTDEAKEALAYMAEYSNTDENEAFAYWYQKDKMAESEIDIPEEVRKYVYEAENICSQLNNGTEEIIVEPLSKYMASIDDFKLSGYEGLSDETKTIFKNAVSLIPGGLAKYYTSLGNTISFSSEQVIFSSNCLSKAQYKDNCIDIKSSDSIPYHFLHAFGHWLYSEIEDSLSEETSELLNSISDNKDSVEEMFAYWYQQYKMMPSLVDGSIIQIMEEAEEVCKGLYSYPK